MISSVSQTSDPALFHTQKPDANNTGSPIFSGQSDYASRQPVKLDAEGVRELIQEIRF